MKKYILPLLVGLLYFNLLWGQLPEGFSDQVVDSSFDLPLGITFEDNGRGYVWEKRGRVYIIDTTGTKMPTPLIDISEEVSNYSDHGLLGFALHPDFRENGYFYLMYVVDRHHLLHFGSADYNPSVTHNFAASIGRITRYTADPSTQFTTTIPESRKILLGEDKTSGISILMSSHGVGSLAFGLDGTLLASCGDAASYQSWDAGSDTTTYYLQALEDGIIREADNIGSFKSQKIDNLNGKILRLDPETGDGVPGNPYFDPDNPRSARSRVFALGFRNPYRFIIRPNTGSHNVETGNPGTLFVGDVGAGWWEELNIITGAGKNCGWPLFRGMAKNYNYTPLRTLNTEATNELLGINGCEEAYFSFQDLIIQETEDPFPFWPNPCDPTQNIPPEYTFMHHRPSLAYINTTRVMYDFLPPFACVGVFNNGLADTLGIGNPLSPAQGTHFTGNSSIPGLFYEGDNFPETYKGKYFHGDYSGWIRVMEYDDANQLKKTESFHDSASNLVSLALNPKDGCIYYLNIFQGSLRKIAYGGALPPLASIEADKYFGSSPLTVSFDATPSSSPSGSALSYFWDFGQGEESQEVTPTITFRASDNQPQSFIVTLRVRDEEGLEDQAEILISVNNTPPNVEITSIKHGDLFPANIPTRLALFAEVSDAEHHENALTYKWETILHHNAHFHPEPTDDRPITSTLIEPVGCGSEMFWYKIILTVTDEEGLSGRDEKEIFPYCGDVFTDIFDLTAQNTGSSVQLQWNTRFEQDLSIFEIERRRSTRDYERIGTVPATGNSNTTVLYSFEDTSPFFGPITYRIKAISSERAYVYSNTATVDFIPEEGFTIFPNPTSNSLNILLKETKESRLKFELFDISGKLVSSLVWQTAIGTNGYLKSIDLGQLADGNYVYRLTNGPDIHSGKIVIAQ